MIISTVWSCAGYNYQNKSNFTDNRKVKKMTWRFTCLKQLKCLKAKVNDLQSFGKPRECVTSG